MNGGPTSKSRHRCIRRDCQGLEAEHGWQQQLREGVDGALLGLPGT